MEVNILSAMIGHTMASVVDGERLDGGMLFTSTDGTTFRFYHSQRCCESVGIEDIIGDVQDLLGSPFVLAEEVSSDGEPPCKCKDDWAEPAGYQWTFYRFGTAKGTVTVRWYGTSNGYYSTGVDLEVVTPDGKKTSSSGW